MSVLIVLAYERKGHGSISVSQVMFAEKKNISKIKCSPFLYSFSKLYQNRRL